MKKALQPCISKEHSYTDPQAIAAVLPAECDEFKWP